jgi:hypothetical protein
VQKLKELWLWFTDKKQNLDLFAAGAAGSAAVQMLLKAHPLLTILCTLLCFWFVREAYEEAFREASEDERADHE